MSKTIQIELPEGVSEDDVKIEFVAKKKPKPKLWVPAKSERFFFIRARGDTESANGFYNSGLFHSATKTHNAYPTRQLADKAAGYLAPLRMLLRTALEIDTALEAEWSHREQEKWCLYMADGHYRMGVCGHWRPFGPVVSTMEKAGQWLELVKAVEAEG